VNDDPSREVGLRQPTSDAGGVRRLNVRVAGQVQYGGAGRKAGEGVDQRQDPLPLHPISDAQEGCFTALSQVAGKWSCRRGDIAARRHHDEAIFGHARCNQFVK